jgi:hypothetical protein
MTSESPQMPGLAAIAALMSETSAAIKLETMARPHETVATFSKSVIFSTMTERKVFSDIKTLVVCGKQDVVLTESGELVGAKTAIRSGDTLTVGSGSFNSITVNNSGGSSTIIGGTISSNGIIMQNDVVTAYGSSVRMAPKKLTITTGNDTVIVVNGKRIGAEGVAETPERPAPAFFLGVGCKLSEVSVGSSANFEITDSRWIDSAIEVDVSTSASLKMPANAHVCQLVLDASTSSTFNGRQMIADRFRMEASTNSTVTDVYCAEGGKIEASTGAIVLVSAREENMVRVQRSTGARVNVSVFPRMVPVAVSSESRKRKDASSELPEKDSKK